LLLHPKSGTFPDVRDAVAGSADFKNLDPSAVIHPAGFLLASKHGIEICPDLRRGPLAGRP
jgi:hypothetical protein